MKNNTIHQNAPLFSITIASHWPFICNFILSTKLFLEKKKNTIHQNCLTSRYIASTMQQIKDSLYKNIEIIVIQEKHLQVNNQTTKQNNGETEANVSLENAKFS